MGLIGIIFILIHKQKPEKILIFFQDFWIFTGTHRQLQLHLKTLVYK